MSEFGVVDLQTSSPLEGIARADALRAGIDLEKLRDQLQEIRDGLAGIAGESAADGLRLETLEIDLTVGAEGSVWFVAKGSAEASIKLTFGRAA
jgi:hypothetical protein